MAQQQTIDLYCKHNGTEQSWGQPIIEQVKKNNVDMAETKTVSWETFPYD